jgi:hypothetical protein
LFEKFGKERYIGSAVCLSILICCVGGIYYLNSGEISRANIEIKKYDRVTDDGLELDSPMYFSKVTTGRPLSLFSEKIHTILDQDYDNLKLRIDKTINKHPSIKITVDDQTQRGREN